MNKHLKELVNQLLRAEGFNNFDPYALASELVRNQKYIVDAYWGGINHDDTCYVIPAPTKLAEVTLALMGHQLSCDEIDFITSKQVLHEAVENYGYGESHLEPEDEATLRKMLKGQKRVLRLWWD
jgi:hypothetical protein